MTRSVCHSMKFTLPATFPSVGSPSLLNPTYPPYLALFCVDQSKLHLSMSRFFRRLPLDKPVVRNNYSFQLVRSAPTATTATAEADAEELALDPTELAWCRSIHGAEDRSDFERQQSSVAPPGNPARAVDPREVWLRSERQTLRRLPRTGAVVFTIRVYQTPVVDLAAEPGVPGRLASAVRGWSEDVAQ